MQYLLTKFVICALRWLKYRALHPSHFGDVEQVFTDDFSVLVFQKVKTWHFVLQAQHYWLISVSVSTWTSYHHFHKCSEKKRRKNRLYSYTLHWFCGLVSLLIISCILMGNFCSHWFGLAVNGGTTVSVPNATPDSKFLCDRSSVLLELYIWYFLIFFHNNLWTRRVEFHIEALFITIATSWLESILQTSAK